MTLAERIAKALGPLGTKERAVREKAYLKSDLVHWGVTVPLVRKAVKAQAKGMTRAELLAAIDALWPQGVFELRSSCGELVVEWLKPRAARASGLTFREATKHLPPRLLTSLTRKAPRGT